MHTSIRPRLAGALFALGFALSSAAQADEARLSPVRRTTIATADPEASLRFYRDLLGFVVEYDRAGAGGGRLAGFVPGAKQGRLIALRQGPSLGGSIGLFHAPGIRPAGDCASPSRVPETTEARAAR